MTYTSTSAGRSPAQIASSKKAVFGAPAYAPFGFSLCSKVPFERLCLSSVHFGANKRRGWHFRVRSLSLKDTLRSRGPVRAASPLLRNLPYERLCLSSAHPRDFCRLLPRRSSTNPRRHTSSLALFARRSLRRHPRLTRVSSRPPRTRHSLRSACSLPYGSRTPVKGGYGAVPNRSAHSSHLFTSSHSCRTITTYDLSSPVHIPASRQIVCRFLISGWSL